jgi:hypothetical protein
VDATALASLAGGERGFPLALRSGCGVGSLESADAVGAQLA